MTNATQITPPAAREAMTGADFQGYSLPPQVRPRMTAIMPANERIIPMKSTAFNLLGGD